MTKLLRSVWLKSNQRRVIWATTIGPTLGKSLQSAFLVTNIFKKKQFELPHAGTHRKHALIATLSHLMLIIWGRTSWSILERSPWDAMNANLEVFLEPIWRSTNYKMTVKNEINAASVVKTNQRKVVWESTMRYTLGRSLSNAFFVTCVTLWNLWQAIRGSKPLVTQERSLKRINHGRYNLQRSNGFLLLSLWLFVLIFLFV